MKHRHCLKAMRQKHVVEVEIGPCSGGYETQACGVIVFMCVCVCVSVCECVYV